MRRGGLLLRGAAAGTELTYTVFDPRASRRGTRPPKLTPLGASQHPKGCPTIVHEDVYRLRVSVVSRSSIACSRVDGCPLGAQRGVLVLELLRRRASAESTPTPRRRDRSYESSCRQRRDRTPREKSCAIRSDIALSVAVLVVEALDRHAHQTRQRVVGVERLDTVFGVAVGDDGPSCWSWKQLHAGGEIAIREYPVAPANRIVIWLSAAGSCSPWRFDCWRH